MFSLIFRVYNSLKFADLNQKVIGSKNYLVIKYESLIKSPKKELKKIQKFLSIKNNLDLKTTFLGDEWNSNNFIGKKKTELSKININKYKKICSKDEIKNLEFYFYNFLKKYKYKINYKEESSINSASGFYKKINKVFFQ